MTRRAALLLCCLLLISLNLSCSSKEKESKTESARPILFTRESGSSSDIYLVNADGSDIKQLTDEGGFDRVAAWSPDGTRIVFVSERDGNPEIYVMNADGSNVTRLTETSAVESDPTWSPDGKKIAYSSARTMQDNSDIYVMNADGTEPTALTDHPGVDMQPSWSNDGTQIAFISWRTDTFEIYVMNADGSDAHPITDTPVFEYAPDWSPDGEQIVFVSADPGDMDVSGFMVAGGRLYLTSESIFVMDEPETQACTIKADGTDLHCLSAVTACGEPVWSADGKQIVFLRNGQLFVVKADGSQEKRVALKRVTDETSEFSVGISGVIDLDW